MARVADGPGARFHLRLALAAAAATLVSVAVADRPLAIALAPTATLARRLTTPPMTALEWATLLPLTKFALGFLLLAAGLVLAWRAPTRDLGRFLGVVGGIHMTTRLLTGVLKVPFGRARPYEVLATGDWRHEWFGDGGAFPSGHAAHFWALLLPVAWRWPRTRIPLLVVTLFVSLSRIAVNDHYLSDVLASIAIAAFMTAGFLDWWERRLVRGEGPVT